MNKIIFSSLAFVTLLGSFQAHAEDLWVKAEYLNWKIQDSPKIIPLVVQTPTAPVFGDRPFRVGVLGVEGNEVVLGGNKIDSKWRSGGRFTVGSSPQDMCQMGWEASYFFLGRSKTTKSVSSDGALGQPFLVTPFINSLTGEEASTFVSFSGTFSGLVDLSVSNSMQGFELYASKPLNDFNGWSVNGFGGFRYLNFDEKLSLFTSSPSIDGSDTYFQNDHFKMDNNFYGASFGVNAFYNYNCFMFNVKAKLGLGAVCQSSKIKGSFTTDLFSADGALTTYDGGVYALPSNSGTKKRTEFSVLPEIELNMGYNVTECLALTLGYNFMYLTNVLRAPNQLSRTINPTQSAGFAGSEDFTPVGAPSPTHRLKSSDFWVQGLNVGLVYSF